MKHGLRIALLCIATAAPAAAAQQTDAPPTITVDASGSVERTPDRAILQLAVESDGATARVASQANAAAMDRVLRALRTQGIPAASIRTLSYGLDPVYGRRTRPDSAPLVVGFRATNLVQVTVDSIAAVGGVIDAAIGAGANRVMGLSFEIRDWEAARLAALEIAVAKARREANAVARAADASLGPPLSISMSSDDSPRPIFQGRVLMEAAMTEPTPIEGGALTVTARVRIVYRLELR